MSLLAKYVLTQWGDLSLTLLDIETGELITVITDGDAGDSPLLTAATAWAEANNHGIAAIDNQVLHS